MESGKARGREDHGVRVAGGDPVPFSELGIWEKIRVGKMMSFVLVILSFFPFK